jgi:hypothetical protein
MQGHYSPADLQYIVEHDGTVLAELNNVSWDFDPSIEAAGAGLGLLKNSYYKTTAAPKGSWKMARAMLQRSDKGLLFLDLATGSRYVVQEAVAAAQTSYTVSLNTALVSILEIRLNTSLAVLREGLDFTVNYTTGVITFAIALPEAATIRYLASSRKLGSYLVNGGFEDALTNIWIVVAGAAIARDSANAYVEGNALKVTPAVANDGVQYNISTTLQPGRQYRFRFKAKAAAAETLVAKWYDGSSLQTMSPASVTLTTTYATYEYTFTSTKATIPYLQIIDSKASPGIFYIDEVALLDDTTGNNPTLGSNVMDEGLAAAPFTFNLIARRVLDGVTVFKLMKCSVSKVGFKSGKEYGEDISGDFLDLITE